MKRFTKVVAVVLVPFILSVLAVAPALGATSSKLVLGTAFKPNFNYDASDVTWIVSGNIVGNMPASTNEAFFWAPVQVPVGSVITQLAFVTYNPTGASSEATLYKAKGWGTDVPVKIAQVGSGAASANWETFTVDATSTRVNSGDVLSISLILHPNTQVRAVKVYYKKP